MQPSILAGYDAPDRDRGLTMRDVLLVVFRRRRVVLLAVSLTAGFATLGAYVLDPTYRAQAQVYVQRERPSTVEVEDARLNHPVLTRTDVINSEVKLLLSRGVIEAAVDDLRLWERQPKPSFFQKVCQPLKDALVAVGMWTRVEPREGKILRLQKQLRVRGEPDADIISVSHVSAEPALSAEIVNAVVDAYLRKRQASLETGERYRFFMQQFERAGVELQDMTAARAAVKRKWNIVDLAQEKRLILDGLTLTENRLQEAMAGAREAEQTRRQLLAEVASLPERVLEATETERSELYDELTAMVARLEAREAELLVRWAPEDPQVLKVTDAIAAVRTRLAGVDAVTPSVERHTLNTVRRTLLERAKMMAATRAGLQAKIAEYRAQRGQQLERLLMLDGREDELEDLDTRIAAGRSKRDLFLQRAEEARVQSESSPNFANVWIINRAAVPQRPRLMPLMALAIGLGLGVVLAGMLVAVAEYFDHSLHNREDIHRHLGVPVLAAIPRYRG